jgi:hypothetical protein
MPAECYALATDDDLLGFYAVKQMDAELSKRSLPFLELSLVGRSKGSRTADKTQSGFLLSSIARSRRTPKGFGRHLLVNAIGVTLNAGLNLIFVQPVNGEVSQMWQTAYSFKPVDWPAPEVPNLLWFPVNPFPEGKWP